MVITAQVNQNGVDAKVTIDIVTKGTHKSHIWQHNTGNKMPAKFSRKG